jgi:hypothetical protein
MMGSVGRLVCRLVGRSVGRPVSQLVGRSVGRSARVLVGRSVGRGVVWAVNEGGWHLLVDEAFPP